MSRRQPMTLEEHDFLARLLVEVKASLWNLGRFLSDRLPVAFSDRVTGIELGLLAQVRSDCDNLFFKDHPATDVRDQPYFGRYDVPPDSGRECFGKPTPGRYLSEHEARQLDRLCFAVRDAVLGAANFASGRIHARTMDRLLAVWHRVHALRMRLETRCERDRAASL